MTNRSLTFLASAVALIAAPVQAQTFSDTAGEWNAPYGGYVGEENRVVSPGTRDASGNRVIVDGRILTAEEATNLPRELGGRARSVGVGSATAIGNQLNVVTQGNWNTVIIDSTQINNGDVVANASGEVLNGEINLND